MSYGPLPKKVDPRKLAERGAKIEGSASPDQMNRLSSLLSDQDNQGELHVRFEFDVDEQRFRTITGDVQGYVFMICQRCLDVVKVPVFAEFCLAITYNEDQTKQLPKHYDPLQLVEEEIELLNVVEDELILSLPQFAYHDDCSVKTSFGEEETASITEKPNPFSVLAQLKANTDKKLN